MLEYLIDENLVSESDRIAVGVSGGADSMLLLWALIDRQKKSKFYFEVINVNHHLRGESGDNDTKFVENFCKKRKIPYKIVDVDVKSLKTSEKMTLEQAARVARFDAFNKVMKEDKLNKLFLAHHKNDQAETILMHIFRGSGVSGACGIKNSDAIFRPLLCYSKAEILKLAKDHGIEFVQDATNNDNELTRNYLRNVVIPDIEKVYPNAVDAIFAFGERCKEIQDYILSSLDANLIEEQAGQILIKNEVMNNPKFIAREYINLAVQKLGVFSDFESKHFELIMSLFDLDTNKELNLPHNVVAKRSYRGVVVSKQTKKSSKEQQYEFVKNGEVMFEGFGKIVTRVADSAHVEYKEGVLFVDAFKISTDAVWRTRKLGDKFAKLGTGAKKLNDYFTDKKIENPKRDNIPVLAVNDKVLAVANFDVSENVKLDGDTEEIIMITIER